MPFLWREHHSQAYHLQLTTHQKQEAEGGGLDISDLIVDLYNGCKTVNLKAGSLRPLSTAVIATNFELRNEPK